MNAAGVPPVGAAVQRPWPSQSLRRHFGTIKRQDPVNESQMRRLVILDGAYDRMAELIEQVSGAAGSEAVSAMRKLLESLDCAQRAVFDSPDMAVPDLRSKA